MKLHSQINIFLSRKEEVEWHWAWSFRVVCVPSSLQKLGFVQGDYFLYEFFYITGSQWEEASASPSPCVRDVHKLCSLCWYGGDISPSVIFPWFYFKGVERGVSVAHISYCDSSKLVPTIWMFKWDD